MSSVATFALIIGADRGSRAYDHEMIEASGVGWDDDSLEHTLGLADKIEEHKRQRYASLGTRGKMLEHFKEHQFQYVLGRSARIFTLSVSWKSTLLTAFSSMRFVL